MRKKALLLLVLLICFMLSACGATSKFEKALDAREYPDVFMLYNENKADKGAELNEILTSKFRMILAEGDYNFAELLTTSFAEDNPDLNPILFEYVSEKLDDYASGAFSYEDTKNMLTSLPSYTLAGNQSVFQTVDEINESKQAFVEAQTAVDAGNYVEALGLYKNVIESDTENYEAAKTQRTELLNTLIGETAKKVETLSASGDYLSAAQMLIDFEEEYRITEGLDTLWATVVKNAYTPIKTQTETCTVNNDVAGVYQLFDALPDELNREEILAIKQEATKMLLPNTFNVSKIWFNDGFANSIDIFINFTNLSEKTVKRATFYLQGYDSVGDKAYDLSSALYGSNLNVDEMQYAICAAKGPFEQGEGFKGTRNYWYKSFFSDVERFELAKLKLEYMDGTSFTITDPSELAYVQ